ncbi:MAG TPA: hypothetical protein VF760_01970 [Xanthobacteraceae bacterium]
MDVPPPPEPFERFAAFFSRYIADEGLQGHIPPSHLPALREAAREMGVIFHDDGSLELIRQ